MAISINDLETGLGLKINDVVFVVTELAHVKPGKGAAFVRVKLKNITTGQVLERTFRNADRLDDVNLEERRLQNLYTTADSIHLMDNSSYEEIIVPKDLIGNDIRFLQDNLEVTAVCIDHKILKIMLPTFIIAEITHTEPGFKGDSSRAGTKNATIDTGTTIQVPLFIEQGEFIKIDTRNGQYVERVKR